MVIKDIEVFMKSARQQRHAGDHRMADHESEIAQSWYRQDH